MTDGQVMIEGYCYCCPTCYCPCLPYLLLPYLLLPPACYCLAYLLLPGLPAIAPCLLQPGLHASAPCLLQPAPPAACAWSQVPYRRECPGRGSTRVSSSGPAAHTARNLQGGCQQGGGAGVKGAGWMSARRGCWGSRVQDGCQQGWGAEVKGA